MCSSDLREEAALMSAIAGVVVGLVVGAGGATAILWPRLQQAEQSKQRLTQDLQRQDQRLTDELNDQGRRHHAAVSSLEAQISSLQATLATAHSNLGSLEAQKRELEAQISSLQTSLATVESDRQAELARHSATAHSLETQISQQREQILALQQCTHNLEQRLTQALQPEVPVQHQSAEIEPPGTAAIAEPPAAVALPLDLGSTILPSTTGVALEDILQQARDRDEQTRANTALALGTIASSSSPQQTAPILRVLTELGRDPSAAVRLAVVESLSDWRSPKVLPLLRQALRDTDPAVVKAANAGLTPFRGALRKAKATKKNVRSQRSAR